MFKCSFLFLYFVVEDDVVDDDWNCSVYLVNEGEGGGGGVDVVGFDVGLDCDEGGLEVGININVCYDLIVDDFGLVKVWIEVVEEFEF